MEAWQETVLWIISILSFFLALSRWIVDIDSIIPKIKLTFRKYDLTKIYVNNVSNQIMMINFIYLYVKNKKNIVEVFPYSYRDLSTMRIASKKMYNFDIPFKDLYELTKNLQLKFPVKIWAKLITNSQTFKSKKLTLKSIEKIDDDKYEYFLK